MAVLPLTNDVYAAISFGNPIAHNRGNKVSLVWSGISSEDDSSALPRARGAGQRRRWQHGEKFGWSTGLHSPDETPAWKLRKLPSWLHRLFALIFP